MSITPIELATMAPKSQETVNMKHSEVQKPTTDRLNANTQVENKVYQEVNTTIRSKNSETPEFRYDAKNKGTASQQYEQQKQGKQGKKKKSETERKRETDAEKMFGRGIDIRI